MKQKKVSRPKTKRVRVRARRVRGREPTRKAHYRTLLAIVMFLYMLRLLDDKTMKKVQDALYPPRRRKTRKRKARRARKSPPAISRARTITPAARTKPNKRGKRRTKRAR